MRKEQIAAPILMLTGKYGVKHLVAALDAGADDYLTKPFRLDELLARVRALLRRSPTLNTPSAELQIADLRLNLTTATATRAHLIPLRPKELQILRYLMHNRGRVVSRTSLYEHVWDSSYEPFTNAVDVHIKNLRQKIDRGFDKQLIHTVRGYGYKIGE